jgi:toxin ParE1/3/4
MVKIRIAKTATIDIRNIYDYVLQQSYQNAELLKQAIFQAVDSLYKFPERGQIVKEIQNPLSREIRLYKYRIIYKCSENEVVILTVHHSARLLINNPHFKDLFQ